MIRLPWPLCVLMLISFATAEVDFDGGLGDLCFSCVCSADRTIVDCSRRGLTELPDGFGSQVTKLNISNNEISTFPKNLHKFYNLVTLDISGNRLNEVPKDALQNLTVLEDLNLSHNYFTSWLNLNPNEAFLPAPNLKKLDLSFNKFATMGNLANQELIISHSLETLILEQCEIDAVYGRSALSGLANIKYLKLNFNPITRIQGLISSTLKSLDVSNCALSIINHNELMYLPSLVHLKMAHNYRLELSSSAYNLFSDSLRYLDISYCNVLQPNLQGFPNLRRAVLNHNMIRFLRSNEFVNNTLLEYLDLSYNNIGSLKSDTFRGLTLIKHLDLSWNEIAIIPEDTLLAMPALTQMKLSRNYLTKVGHLKSNSVTVLDLSSCEISVIGPDSLEGLQSLVDLDLSRNLLTHIPDSISSNTLKYLNLNYNRLTFVNNYTFFMLPRLIGLSVIGNRFTTIWRRSYFESNPYLERLDLSDNMWRCDCGDGNMYDFYEFITLEPNKKEESYNLVCNSPLSLIGQTWLEACYFVWNPTEKVPSPDGLIWFITVMIVGLTLCLLLVNCIRRSMQRRLAVIQAERERQVEEARDRLRQLRIRAEQEALCNTPDPRDLIAPPSYDEALSMPKLNASCHSLNETGTGKTRRKRGRRKTKSSGDLLEETERNGDVRVLDDVELSETSNDRRRRPRRQISRYGSHEVAELDQSPGARRRRMSEYNADYDSQNDDNVTVEVQAELERPLRPRPRRYSNGDNNLRESDF
ncbi:insulin-like growth factor-binding protein complex acid labile subunit [Helicoverpa zea]|uniref:insulin-like growth factor-binding protein complex acid labile subunit n=1 Tax=Helicoverpa zea TaxID=7113 RepID=UPI001F5805FB|nr:insulin-like growth factor-binding protein complex acid labile subunit [Helicoverpa zea]XP_047023486.1 insulin-like growth factor-binding protein complex acid labile subunit [Helicoverpa zea]XP_047023491.1 insulin-like growth factor-binding protein complex acid labile subunit [Helicoverpa zea]